ncbi:MAG: hypothetical protein WC947_01360 [Elusimicrobiota bacterium]
MQRKIVAMVFSCLVLLFGVFQSITFAQDPAQTQAKRSEIKHLRWGATWDYIGGGLCIAGGGYLIYLGSKDSEATYQWIGYILGGSFIISGIKSIVKGVNKENTADNLERQLSMGSFLNYESGRFRVSLPTLQYSHSPIHNSNYIQLSALAIKFQ